MSAMSGVGVAKPTVPAYVCPACGGPLVVQAADIVCEVAGHRYPITSDGIPIFADPEATLHDELEHLRGAGEHDHGCSHPAESDHKVEQAAYFDAEPLAEFEIERPFGAPRLYRHLLTQKFARAVEPLGSLEGWTALAVCGGSGMDAEFLARAGATVVSADISQEATRRAAERARRHREPFVAIVADIEHLPFADQSFDLVYVHDGLHHLANPQAGLLEMARVARRAVAVTEPGEAAATNLAIRLGLALAVEEAGNRVARMRGQDVNAILALQGLITTRNERYAMVYRHQPGLLTRVFSWPFLYELVRSYLWAVDRLIGRFGNKLVVIAERPVNHA